MPMAPCSHTKSKRKEKRTFVYLAVYLFIFEIQKLIEYQVNAEPRFKLRGVLFSGFLELLVYKLVLESSKLLHFVILLPKIKFEL